MRDEGGVLGNLPSSRPGKRSAKRDRPAKTAARAAAKAEAGGKAAAQPPRTSRAARTSPKPGRAAAGKTGPKPRQRVEPVPHGPSDDPVGAVVRGAAGLAVAGVKVAGAVTHELLRRLPRP
jgi:hypothetical protein